MTKQLKARQTTTNLPSPELLRKLLRYEPETGKLFWLPRPIEMFATVGAGKIWNSRYPGKEAFTADNGTGYRHGEVNGKTLRSHRVIWAIVHGTWPTGDIDHINGVKTDNRIANLRDVSSSINQRNAKKRDDNTSGYNGVSRYRQSGKWQAHITIDGKNKHLGYFDTPDDAVAARAAAERGLGFTERHGT